LLLPNGGHNDIFDNHFDDLLEEMMKFAKTNGLES